MRDWPPHCPGSGTRQKKHGTEVAMSTTSAGKGILDGANVESREKVIDLLCKAYWMEVETVMSYIAASVNLDGVRAQEVKESLAEDVEEELGHAKQFAARI